MNAFLLKWKTVKRHQRKGRELDPKWFDQVEKNAFDFSDAKEWQSFLDTDSVDIISPTIKSPFAASGLKPTAMRPSGPERLRMAYQVLAAGCHSTATKFL